VIIYNLQILASRFQDTESDEGNNTYISEFEVVTGLQYNTVQYCTVLYHIVLHCTVLYYTA